MVAALSIAPPHVLQIIIKEDRICAFRNSNGLMRIIHFPNDAFSGARLDILFKKSMKMLPKYKFKAINFIFNSNSLESHEIRQLCQEFCEKNGYFCYFSSQWDLAFISSLFQTKTFVSMGERVATCYICDNIFQFWVAIRHQNFYELQFLNTNEIDLENSDFFKSFYTFDAINKFNPKKILIITETSETTSFQTYFNENVSASMLQKALSPDYEVIMCDNTLSEYGFDATYANVLDAMDEKKYPFVLQKLLDNDFNLFFGNTKLIHAKGLITLPFEKNFKVNVKSINDFIELKMRNGKTIKRINLEEYIGQEVVVIFKVDNDCFYSLFIDQQQTQKVAECLAKNLKIWTNVKAKIIFSQMKFSIELSKSGKEKDWKPLEQNIPLIISFGNVNPIVGEEAFEIVNKKSNCLVFDLLSLCAVTDPDDVFPKWPFMVNFDENNEISIEFDALEGRKAASIELLIGLVLNDCLKRIKKATGMKLNELEIQIKFHGNKKMVKEKFRKVGEFLKVKINFV